jgi:arylsulfatase A-like enzyme
MRQIRSFVNRVRLIKYKTVYRRFAFSFVAIISLLNVSLAQQAKKGAPNIIFIIVDDQGYGDLGVFFQNQRAKLKDAAKPFHLSPNIDQLAREGVMLTQYYCAAPICAPSRASLLLGVSQGHANVRDNQFDKALENNYTMASTLRTLGYSTAAIGKWGLQGNDKYDINGYQWPAHPLKRGFDYYFGYMRHSDGHEHYPKEALYRKYWAENAKIVWQNYTNISAGLDKCYTADLWTAAAKKYITDHVSSKERNKPFLLYLAYDTPHATQELPGTSYPAGRGLKGGIQWIGKPGRFINTATGTPDSYIYPEYVSATYDHDSSKTTPDVSWPETYKRYATANRRIDDAVGDITQLLKDLKIDSNTIVVYTSDNGPSRESYLPENRYEPNRPTFFSSYGPFDGIKGDVWEGGVRVPAIAWWPSHIAAGKTVSLPAIAYDWAPTLIELAGAPAPQRMDGVSLVPSLTGKSQNENRLLYIEYQNDETTPDYEQFHPGHRNRERKQMQLLRMGDYVGVRYNIRSAEDDFEIYNVVTDPKQEYNLALKKEGLHSFSLPVHYPQGNRFSTKNPDIQAYLKAKALQMRQYNASAPRPYDSALIPAAIVDKLMPGVSIQYYKGNFPWIPQLTNLKAETTGHSPLPAIEAGKARLNGLTFFSGYIEVPQDGAYTFYMSADVKAFLRIHDVQLIDQDYAYPGNLIRTATIHLKAGMHPFWLYYLRNTDNGPPFLKLDWSGPGMARQRMKQEVFFTDKAN